MGGYNSRLNDMASDIAVGAWKYQAGSGVASVAISADGETVLAGTLGKQAVCLDGAGRLRWQAPVGNQAWRAGLSHDGRRAVIGTGSTRFWDMEGRGLFFFEGDGSLLWKEDLRASVWGMSLSANGEVLAAGTSSRQLLVFDRQGHRLWQQDVPGAGWYAWVWCTALSANGEVVVAGAADNRLRILNRGGKLLAEHSTHGEVFAVAISADGRTIAAGDNERHVYLLDQAGALLWKDQRSDKIWAVALSDDGEQVLIGAGEKEGHLLSFDRSGQMLWKRHVGGSVSNVTLSADGRRVVAGTREGGIYVFGEDGEVVHQARAEANVRDVAITAGGDRAVAVSEDECIYGFNLPLSPVRATRRSDGTQPVKLESESDGRQPDGLAHMRRENVQRLIREANDLIAQYERKRLLSDDPREQLNLERQIADLRKQMEGYQAELKMLSEPKEVVPSDADVVILTILPEEYLAVCDKLIDLQPAPRRSDHADVYAWKTGRIPSGENAYSVAVGMMGRAGTTASALATKDAVDRWNPRYIFFVGVAGGLKNLNKGDVVIADIIHGYEYGKFENKAFTPRSDWTYKTDLGLLNGAVAHAASDWKVRVTAQPPLPTSLKAVAGEVASGDKVVDDPSHAFFVEILKTWPKIVAVEMEGAGAGNAIEQIQALGKTVHYMMIRGISDLPRPSASEPTGEIYGTAERDAWKVYAADTAAAFVVSFIAGGLPLPPR